MFSVPTLTPQPRDIRIGVVPFHPQIPEERFLYSEARLGGLVALTPCKGIVRGREAIIGILLLYADGARRCVGQVRFDSMLGTLDVRERAWGVGKDVADDTTIVSVDTFPPRASGVD